MKDAIFLGDTLKAIRAFPENARRTAVRIRRVQRGQEPIDWKPFPTIGPNVREIRIRESGGAFRVIYQATIADLVIVVSAFEKKTQKTPQHEIHGPYTPSAGIGLLGFSDKGLSR